MADSLYEALAGLQASPAETPYGIASQSLAATTPQLFTPYTSPGAAVGIGLGSVLLQSLLGYQAKQSALENTLQANSLANQMLKMQTPEQRTSFLGGLDVSPDIGSRLSTLSTALTQQELARKTAAANKLLELETAANFQLGPKGTELFKREQDAEIAKAAAQRKAAEPKDAWESIGKEDQTKLVTAKGQIAELRDLANKFRTLDSYALSKGIASLSPSSETSLAIARMNILVPSTARLMGEVGNLAQQEQDRLIKSTLGDWRSGTETIAKRLEQLANSASNIVENKLSSYQTAAKYGIEGLKQELQATRKQPEPVPTNDVEQRKAFLRQEIARKEAERQARLQQGR